MNIPVPPSWQSMDTGHIMGALRLLERHPPVAAGNALATQLAGSNRMRLLMGSASNLASPSITATLIT